MAKTEKKLVQTPEQKARQKARAKEARKLEGGHPSLRGIVVKILLLSILDAGAMFAALLLIAKHQFLYLGVLVVFALVINWLYLRKGHLPAKYLAPGVVLLILFQISVVFFSGYIAFTNYGALHNGSKQDAVAAIRLTTMVNDTNADFMYVQPVMDPAHGNSIEWLATDTTDAANIKYYLGGADWKNQAWHELTPAEFANVKLGPSTFDGTEIAVSIKGYKSLTVDQINAAGIEVINFGDSGITAFQREPLSRIKETTERMKQYAENEYACTH